MIEIDLLPLELRKKKTIPFEFDKILKVKVVFIFLGSLVLIHLFLHALTFINAKRLDKVKQSWQGLSSKMVQIEQLKGELAKINKKVPLIEQLVSNRVLWSKKLNGMSDLIIPGIWLKELTVEKKKTNGESVECLIIRASAASRTKDEPALIGRFMQNLKDDPSFAADFAEIELGPIKKRLISHTEVMDFILTCQFKPDKAKALLK